jgi:hypothetical protein
VTYRVAEGSPMERTAETFAVGQIVRIVDRFDVIPSIRGHVGRVVELLDVAPRGLGPRSHYIRVEVDDVVYAAPPKHLEPF